MLETLSNLIRIRSKLVSCVANVPWFSVILEVFFTHLTMHCLKCLFHMNNHIDQVGTVNPVKIISRWNGPSGNIKKNHLPLWPAKVDTPHGNFEMPSRLNKKDWCGLFFTGWRLDLDHCTIRSTWSLSCNWLTQWPMAASEVGFKHSSYLIIFWYYKTR